MEGILRLDGPPSFQPTASPANRKKLTRSRSGCLSCRKRRKKCDGGHPVCQGCVRNRLICAWPAYNGLEDDLISQRNGTSNLQPDHPAERQAPSNLSQASCTPEAVTSSPFFPVDSPLGHYTPSASRPSEPVLRINRVEPPLRTPWRTLPAWLLQNDPDVLSQRLYHNFVSSTSVWLGTLTRPLNPYTTTLLPMAVTDDAIFHAILAISGSHLSVSEQRAVVPARTHYAIALRSAKYSVTQIASGDHAKVLHLVVLLLALCHFEVS
jgi:hypothetical protein